MQDECTTSLLLIITLRFTCGETENRSAIKKSQNIMNMVACKKFFLIFMSLLTAIIVGNSLILAVIYIIFLNKCPRPNWKGF